MTFTKAGSCINLSYVLKAELGRRKCSGIAEGKDEQCLTVLRRPGEWDKENGQGHWVDVSGSPWQP